MVSEQSFWRFVALDTSDKLNIVKTVDAQLSASTCPVVSTSFKEITHSIYWFSKLTVVGKSKKQMTVDAIIPIIHRPCIMAASVERYDLKDRTH